MSLHDVAGGSRGGAGGPAQRPRVRTPPRQPDPAHHSSTTSGGSSHLLRWESPPGSGGCAEAAKLAGRTIDPETRSTRCTYPTIRPGHLGQKNASAGVKHRFLPRTRTSITMREQTENKPGRKADLTADLMKASTMVNGDGKQEDSPESSPGQEQLWTNTRSTRSHAKSAGNKTAVGSTNHKANGTVFEQLDIYNHEKSCKTKFDWTSAFFSDSTEDFQDQDEKDVHRVRGQGGWETSLRPRPSPRISFQAGQPMPTSPQRGMMRARDDLSSQPVLRKASGAR